MSNVTKQQQESNETAVMFNGLDVKKGEEIIGMLERQPSLAMFTFRASNRWEDGFRNRSEIQGFYGAGSEDASRPKPFSVVADEPLALLGTDRAPNPAEYLLHAMAACITTTIVDRATAKGIRIEEITSRLEGDIDVLGSLGLADDQAPGFENIRITFSIKADVPDEQLQEVLNAGTRYSPILDTIKRAVNVQVDLEK
jgi:uncharacterized OsmC-like protein